MKIAGSITAEVMDAVSALIAPGITTGELDSFAEEQILKRGCKPAFKGYMGYPASLCVSLNQEVVHGIPGTRMLEDGDIVSLDLGVIYEGYYGDMARSFGVGRVSEAALDLISAAEGSFFAGIKQAVPGGFLGDVSHAIESYATEKGFSVVRDFVGHGIGRKMHEEPQVPNYGTPGTGPRLRQGMTLAIEPMVNAGTHKVKVLEDHWTVVTEDGRLSAHYENTIVIGRKGPEVITCQKKKL